MNLIGQLMYYDELYYVYLRDLKSSETWYLISPTHKEDITAKFLGQPPNYPTYEIREDIKEIPEDYILEAVTRTKISGEVSYYGKINILEEVMKSVSYAKSYSFKKHDTISEVTVSSGVLIRHYEGNDRNLSIKYTTVDKLYQSLSVSNNNIVLNLRESKAKKIPPTVIFTVANTEQRKRVLLASITSVDYETLKSIVDLSWYEEDGVIKKNYQTIETIEEFETKCMTPFIETLQKGLSQKVNILVGLDTETTGLGIWNLAKDNPLRDHIVSLQLSWEDNQGVIIFLDMEYFNNVPIDYVIDRLKPLFVEERGPIKTYKLIPYTPPKQLESLSAFEDSPITKHLGAFSNKFNKEEVILERDSISLGAHNCMFDGKVCYSEGMEVYFDEDSLQMAFNLDPKLAKGDNKLKNLTRRLFNHETPELEDVLGKGNEDKFKYITDKRVAAIYGCADTDYFRLVWKKLKELTPPKMYNSYKQQDPPLLNMLYKAEYYGLMTNEQLVIKQSEIIKQDLERLKDFIYNFVGIQLALSTELKTLSIKQSIGNITPEEYKAMLSDIKIDPESRYEFNIKGAELRKVLYDYLGYPVTVYTKGKKQLPSVDKLAMKKLMSKKLDTPSSFLQEDLMSVNKEKPSVLVSAEEFNSYKYPLAYVLSVYGSLYKEYTSYYKPIAETNMEGKLCKSFSTTRIETRRIMNPTQTVKGDLKELVVPYSEDYYLADFDMSQVEARIFVSLAQDTVLMEKMKDPEKDYHTENAALVNSKPAHKVTKAERSKAKAIGFGLPYGLGEYKMCGDIFPVVNEDNLYQTRKMIKTYKDANHITIEKLESFRDSALVEYDMSTGLRKFLGYEGKPIGRITNLMGFHRLFNLEDLTYKKEGQIRRAAGNYPIQGFASELFRIILRRFYNRLLKEGLRDKIIVHMLIHDELLFSVHKSVHPFYLYKIIKEECMITLKGHTKYFVGINIGNTWLDCKDDKSEAPVKFVDEIVKRYDEGEFTETWIDDPKSYVAKYKHAYLVKRVKEVLTTLQPDIETAPIDYTRILSNFDNYTVRSYVLSYFKPLRSYDKSNDDEKYLAYFEGWVSECFGQDKEIIYPNGSVMTVAQSIASNGPVTDQFAELEIELDDIDSEQDDDYWSFDDYVIGENLVDIAFNNDFDNDEDYLGYDVDFDVKGAKSVADLTIKKTPKYDYISLVNGQLIIKVNRLYDINKIKSYLLPFKDTEGYPTLFKTSLGLQRGFTVSSSTSLEELDKYVKEVI